jgi:Na+-transporting NADH:ubiquinone oxidoreductase subunit NqrB
MAGIETRRIGVASTAELQAAVAEYTAQGFQLKAMTDTTASLEKIESAYNVKRAVLLALLCILPGIIYAIKNINKKTGEIILIQVEARP